jgi:hypothetical protein
MAAAKHIFLFEKMLKKETDSRGLALLMEFSQGPSVKHHQKTFILLHHLSAESIRARKKLTYIQSKRNFIHRLLEQEISCLIG